MTDPIVILSYARTPMGSFQGSLADVTAPQLGATAVEAAVERAGVAPAAIERIHMGCVLPAGLGQAPARQAAIFAGLGEHVEATTVNKMCGSGMQATIMGAEALASAPRSSGRWALVNKFKDAIQESARPPLGGSDTWSRVAVDACATGGHENGIGLARLMGRAIMTGPRDTAWGLRSVQIHGVLAHPLGVGTPMGATGWGAPRTSVALGLGLAARSRFAGRGFARRGLAGRLLGLLLL